jgi:hypothetical protein
MLRELASDLWVTERPLRFAGLEIGTRMTVIGLPGRSLFLHSPVSLDPELRKELESRGSVRYVVAPNRFHHLSVGDYAQAFPDVRIFAAPGLEQKRPDLCFDAVLGDEAPEAWRGEIEQRVFRGLPMTNEVVFFHRRSRTLVLTDLAFNFGEESPGLTRFAMRLAGGYGRFGPTLLERLLIRDRVAARSSLDRILEWDFDRVVVTHGSVLESGGREALSAGYAWL